jgi:2-oxoglutarate dehydrogenase complex dehydrogenase (E1) component-like enzyme
VSTAPRAIAPSVNGWNAEYLEAEYQRFRSDPASVTPDLAAFFHGFDLADGAWRRSRDARHIGTASSGRGDAGDSARFQWAVDNLIVAYRESGTLPRNSILSGASGRGHRSSCCRTTA